MTRNQPRRLTKLLIGAAVVGTLVAGTSATALARSDTAASAAKRATSLYIVQMTDAPVVAYTGGTAGLKATRPAAGEKIDPLSTDVVKYVGYLKAKHNAVLDKTGGRRVYHYVYSYNGFAAKMTAAQAAAARSVGGVLAVSRNEFQKLDTTRTPGFLGLDAAGGLWDQVGGSKDAGEGVVVGVVDSGIWPENPSFSDRDAKGKLVFQQIPGWNGKCKPGEAFAASSCNQKLTAAQWFGAGFGGRDDVKATFPYEYWSARGADGHGSHTAGTAAGNYGVDMVVDGVNLGNGSGIAPRARVAVYKACWGFGSDPAGGCATVDTVAAIDQAVADGVDVINYSISGSRTSNLDPVEVSFLFAADAGVFVAASAGNSGPTASTVAHNAPWLSTVAAGTHDRAYLATATLGDGATYDGVGLGAAVASSPLIASSAAASAGANPAEAALCFLGTLDPAKVTDKIVVCDRGVIARTEKSLEVRNAGGVGMILVNTSPNSLNADLHYVPTVHLQNTARAAVLGYAATPGATASLSAGEQIEGAVAPDIASFSSRGPALAGTGDLLKPDIMAPGVDVLAAVSPIEAGRNFDFLSGTSMSSPHVAGLGALLSDKYPAWSPAAQKSALMTTATTKRNNGTDIPGNPFGYGAGHVVPNKAGDPGLVYDAGFNDWLAFLCATEPGALNPATCTSLADAGYPTDASDLNYPSIAIGALAGQQTVTRTVTNVGPAGTYDVSVSTPAGTTVSVSPTSLTLAKGEKGTYTVTITRTTAALNAYAFGSLSWSDGTRSVRSPIVVRPVAISAPAEVGGTGTSGSVSFGVSFGYDGIYAAGDHGLVAATTNEGNVADDPDNTFDPNDPTGTAQFDIVVPAGTALARFSLFDDAVDGNDDLDMYVFRSGALVGSSGGGTSAESVSLVLPQAGTYTVYVHAWQSDGPDTNFTLFNWNVAADPTADDGSLTVTAPPVAEVGVPGTVQASWSGLTAGTRYLGAVSHSGPSGLLGLTVVSVRG